MLIIFLPVVLLILTLVYDIGTVIYEKNRIDNTNYLVNNYVLDNNVLDENKIIDIIRKSDDGLNTIEVMVKNEEINIFLSKDVSSVFGKMFGFNIFTVKSKYRGTILNNNKKIEKVR